LTLQGRMLPRSADPTKLLEREKHFHRHLEICGDLQSEIETGTVFAPLKIPDRLIVHTESLSEVSSRDVSLGAQHRNTVMYRLGHPELHSPLLLHISAARGERGA